MTELLQDDLPDLAEVPASQEVVDAEFAEIVDGIDEAFNEMPQEQKEAIANRNSGEKRLWNGDGENNFGSEV